MQAQVLEYERLELDHFWEIHRRQLEDRDLERLGASPPPTQQQYPRLACPSVCVPKSKPHQGGILLIWFRRIPLVGPLRSSHLSSLSMFRDDTI